MQPAQAEGGGSSSNALKKWGPIGAIVLVIAAIAGIVLVTGGDDDDGDDAAADTTTAVTEVPEATEAPDATDAPEETTPESTEPADGGGGGGDIAFPLSFSQAEEQGIEVAWDERCDTDTGNLAIKWFFAPECYAPFEGDNGGETTRGVTADTIKVVQYQGPDDDPIASGSCPAVDKAQLLAIFPRIRTPRNGDGSTNVEYLPPAEKIAWVMGRWEMLTTGLQ